VRPKVKLFPLTIADLPEVHVNERASSRHLHVEVNRAILKPHVGTVSEPCFDFEHIASLDIRLSRAIAAKLPAIAGKRKRTFGSGLGID
jgi:hypothetical protein